MDDLRAADAAKPNLEGIRNGLRVNSGKLIGPADPDLNGTEWPQDKVVGIFASPGRTAHANQLKFTAQRSKFSLAGKRFAESCLPASGNIFVGLTPGRSNAFRCSGVEVLVSLKLSDGPMETSFGATVERLASRAKELRIAPSRRRWLHLGSTGEARCARAAS